MISVYLSVLIDRPQNAVFIGFFIVAFLDAEVEKRRVGAERKGG